MKIFPHILRLFVVGTLLTAVAYAGEPRMIDAINALRRAKTSAEPWKDLDVAAQNLRFASKNKANYRGEALSIVEGIISSHPDKITFDRMIDQAIAKAEEGASVSHGHGRHR